MSDADAKPQESGWREWVPAVALGVWLAAFWFLSPQPWHRALLGFLVIPSLAVLPAGRLGGVGRMRWLWLALGLLGWQMLSRGWSGGENSPPGWWLDALLVAGLLVALLANGRARLLAAIVVPGLSLVSAAAAVVSLVAFYAPAARHPAVDRLRNVFFHDMGLNPVPTGFLFAFGTLVAARWMGAARRREMRRLHGAAMVLSLLGLLASQSRGPMLMCAAGLACLWLCDRKRAARALWTGAGVSLAFFAFLFVSSAGREATLDLVQRGSTGRFDIYRWFLGQMDIRDLFLGRGMGRAPVMPAEAFGWAANHPHSIYLTQFYQTGGIGLALLLALVGAGLRAALALARRGDPLWLCLLAGGCVALLFDGAQVFTVWSLARVEPLLIVVPAAIAIGRAGLSRTGTGA